MKRAVAYARYSTDKQTDISIEAQLSAIKEYCKRKGYELIEEYIDRAESGYRAERESFQRMMEDAQKKKFDVVVVYNFSRFARNMQDALNYSMQLERLGINLESTTEPSEKTASGVFIKNILFATYQFQRDLTREDVISKMRELAKKGYWLGGNPPYGFKLEKVKDEAGIERTKLSIVPEEAEVVRKIFEWYSQGLGIRKIIQLLEREGITNRGKPWTTAGIHSILRNIKYTGTYVWMKGTKKNHKIFRKDAVVIENAFPVIVPKELFEKVQQMMKKRGTVKRSKHHYFLKGLAKCAICGRNLIGEITSVPTYRCPLQRKEKNHARTSARRLESFVIDYLRTILNKLKEADFEVLAERLNEQIALKNEELKRRKETLLSRLVEIEADIRNIIEAIKKGILTAELEKEAQALENERQKIKQELANLNERTFVTAETLRKKYNELLEALFNDPELAVRKLVKEIIVYPSGFAEIHLIDEGL